MKTLRLTMPMSKTALQALLMVFLFAGAMEAVSRIPALQTFLQPYEFYGSAHPQFDIQLRNIKARNNLEGKIDCIVIGNSQTLYGVNPEAVEQAYFTQTGKHITCQNFGNGGVLPNTVYSLINILIKQYQPAVVIFGTSVLDYSSSQNGGAHASIMSSPWVRYQMGTFSVDGWLFEYSSAYRYYRGIDQYVFRSTASHPIQINGYSSQPIPRSQLSKDEQYEYFKNMLPSSKRFSQQQIGFLKKILRLQNRQTQIILLEAPIEYAMFEFSPRLKKMHPEFLKMAKSAARNAGVDIWLTQNEMTFDEEMWYDLIHLNPAGALFYSEMIGDSLAKNAALFSQ